LLFSVIWPYVRGIWRTFLTAWSQKRIYRFLGVFTFLLLVVPLLLFKVPMPYSTIAYGMAIPPERSVVRAGATGFVRDAHISDGDPVANGQALLDLFNVELIQTESELAAKLEQLNAEYRAALNINPAESRRLAESIEFSMQKQNDLLDEIQNLVIVSPENGYFSRARNRAVPGGYIRKGDIVGFVINPGESTIRIMVPQDSIDAVRRQTITVTAMSLNQPDRIYEVKAANVRPMITSRLPDASLGSLSGGPIPVDARDPEGLILMTPMFQADLTLANSAKYIGETFIVKFLHYNQPIGIRIYQKVRKRLSTEFSL